MRLTHLVGSLSGAALAFALAACGSSTNQDFAGVDGGADGTADPDSSLIGTDEDAKPPCVGLQCNQVTCDPGLDTTVSGTVFAPNGKLPLYNAIVYVPNATPRAFDKGVTCDQCGVVASGNPVVTALSQPNGTFTLRNVPVGTDVPLVIQIGKWRRQVKIPEVKRCQDNKLPAELTRLPKNRAEGDLPRIALTTGGCDRLGCMLPKVGIDPKEFGVATDGDAKSIHAYLGAGGGGPSGSAQANALWTDVTKMKYYDMLILSCECSEHLENKGAAAEQAMTDYLKAGGRIFTTDFMYSWYRYTPDAPLKSVANITGGAPIGTNPVSMDTTFAKGKALVDWLKTVFPSSPVVQAGNVPFDVVFANLQSVDQAKAQTWGSSAAKPRIFTVNVPVGVPVAQQCGKGVHIDAHVNQSGAADQVNTSYPASCTAPLKEGESALAFFFFDLASCIQNEKDPPPVPPIPR